MRCTYFVFIRSINRLSVYVSIFTIFIVTPAMSTTFKFRSTQFTFCTIQSSSRGIGTRELHLITLPKTNT